MNSKLLPRTVANDPNNLQSPDALTAGPLLGDDGGASGTEAVVTGSASDSAGKSTLEGAARVGQAAVRCHRGARDG